MFAAVSTDDPDDEPSNLAEIASGVSLDSPQRRMADLEPSVDVDVVGGVRFDVVFVGPQIVDSSCPDVEPTSLQFSSFCRTFKCFQSFTNSLVPQGTSHFCNKIHTT